MVINVKEGDFIKLEFDAFIKETDQLMDTTHEEIAKEHDIFDERVNYSPISIIVGAGQVVKGLDRSLLEADVGKDIEVEIKPEYAFGEKDPKLIEIFPMNKILSLPEFRKGDKYPSEGMEIRINNRMGYISKIFAGRVRLDFNNRWAGKTINYKYKVTEVLETKEDKIRALIGSVHPGDDDFAFEFTGDDEVVITLPDTVKLDPNWSMAKFRLVSDLRKYFDVRTVKLVEVYIRREEAKEEISEKECDDPNCTHEHHGKEDDENNADDNAPEKEKEDDPVKEQGE